MTQQIEFLDWDSEFFGVAIGRVDLTAATADDFEAIDTEARDRELACVYGSMDPAVDDGSFLAQEWGHRLVEIAIAFARPDKPFVAKETVSVARRGTPADLAALAPAIDTLAHWSRYAIDPRFGHRSARRMHEAWVSRAASDETDERMLAITEDETGITGLATHVRSPVPRVDLMGVIKQGSGASWALLAELVDWAGGGEIAAGPCAARNVAPCRFLEHCGFAMSGSQYLFHRWYDDSAVVKDAASD